MHDKTTDGITNPTHLRIGMLCFVMIIYALAFALPAASFPGRMGPIRLGDEVIAEGGDALPPAQFAGHQAFYHAMRLGRVDWFANPALWLGFVLLACRQWILCGIAGTCAFLLGILSFLVYDSTGSTTAGDVSRRILVLAGKHDRIGCNRLGRLLAIHANKTTARGSGILLTNRTDVCSLA